MKTHFHLAAAFILAASPAVANAAPPVPNEFENAGDELGPLFAYFAGVTAWGTALAATPVHSGGSLEVWANLGPDWAPFSGFAVGTFGTSAPQLAIDPAADTFSVSIQAPTNGQLSFYVVVREDDNGDGIIDPNLADDQWETATVMLAPGSRAYNFTFADFTDVDPDAGNNLRNFTTTPRMAYLLVFETADSYPGGHIVEPVSFHVDHVGFYVGPQSIPTSARPADIDRDGVVGVTDFLAVLAAWGACTGCPEDIDNDGLVGVTDFLGVLADWG